MPSKRKKGVAGNPPPPARSERTLLRRDYTSKVAAFAGANADHFLDGRDHDFAITDGAGLGALAGMASITASPATESGTATMSRTLGTKFTA